MNIYLAELVGTALLVLLGNGVVANVVLHQSKASGAGWLAIATGWGLAVYVAVLCVGQFSGAHINPAVTVGLALAGRFGWALAPGYIAAQMAGAFLGAIIVYLHFSQHYHVTKDADTKLATFCTAPAIRGPLVNSYCELVGTFVLVYAVLLMSDPSFATADLGEVTIGLGSIGAVRVGLIVFSLVLCLGGTTGYALNPARDLGPRIAHALLPVPGKRDSDWGYAPVPIIGPLMGGAAAALFYSLH